MTGRLKERAGGPGAETGVPDTETGGPGAGVVTGGVETERGRNDDPGEAEAGSVMIGGGEAGPPERGGVEVHSPSGVHSSCFLFSSVFTKN